MKVAIIPARGGSKRIERKNIRCFAGKPMIAHSILAARQSGLFDRIIVSTEDVEIGRVAKECGAELPFMRPRELADDHTGTIPVIAHAVTWLMQHGQQPSAVCCITATAPFLSSADLSGAYQLFCRGSWDYVFSATDFAFPIFRAFERMSDGGLQMFHPEHFSTRSQDLPRALHDAGQFYWGRPEAWTNQVKIFGPTATVWELPRYRVQDIDTLEDWTRAELMYHALTHVPAKAAA